jgi:transcriptional regulator EpsA
MPPLSENSEESAKLLFGMISESIRINNHYEFFLWLQGRIQQYLPHEVMIAAWGDFSLGIIYYDIVSAIPGIRTNLLDEEHMVPFLRRLHSYWINHDRTPFQILSEKSVIRCRDIKDAQIQSDLQGMKSALIHAIRDSRGGQDSLYVLLSTKKQISPSTRTAFQHLLPYIDASLKQIDHLPEQKPGIMASNTASISQDEDYALSGREVEIMEWVCHGKTNGEIGTILNISPFTVKNHLQRIFKKLNVFNRSQAVSKFTSSLTN